MADALDALRTASPLHRIEAALEARLQAVFPPARFHHNVVPSRVTPPVWEMLTRHTPFVGRGWAGVKPRRQMAGGFAGDARFLVYLLDRTDLSVLLLRGEPTRPGQFGMAMVAAAALSGLRVQGVGTAEVTGVDNAYVEGLGAEKTHLTVVEVTVPISLLDELAPGQIDDFLWAAITWPDIPPAPPATATTDLVTVRSA